jgi:4'-phosphopantetheinyl transferase
MAVCVSPRSDAAVASRRLRERDVAIWQLRLEPGDAALTRAESTLSGDERRAADRGTAPVRRRRIALRAGLRRVLAGILDVAPSQVPLRATATGRPEVDLRGARLDISCSASGGIGLVAVALGLRIGIDVERVAPWDDAVLDEGWLATAEKAALLALPPGDRAEATARCWTRKESVLKAVGAGLTWPPEAMMVGLDSTRVADWSLTPVGVPPGFVATVATSVPLSGRAHALTFGLLADDDGML